jgi:hypothetical protein
MTTNSDLINYLKFAEIELQKQQTINANRKLAIALTHLQTAILWIKDIEKPD